MGGGKALTVSRGWRLRLRSVLESVCCSLCTRPPVGGYIGTDHIDTTVARNSNDAVERTQINAHNRHVYTGSRGIVYWE